MLLMVLAMIIVPMMDVFAKVLSTSHAMSPVMITFVRFLGQAVLLFFVIWFTRGLGAVKGNFIIINLLRGMLVGAAVSMFFIAIKYLPLADAIAIFFVEPLIVLFLSSIFLGEKVGWRRNAAAIIGFGGALLIIQPTYEVFGAKALLPLVTACLFAIYLILSRKIGQRDHPVTMQFWSGMGGILICGLFMIIGTYAGLEDFHFTLPQTSTAVLMLLAVIGIATAGHLMIIVAFCEGRSLHPGTISVSGDRHHDRCRISGIWRFSLAHKVARYCHHCWLRSLYFPAGTQGRNHHHPAKRHSPAIDLPS